MARLTRRRALTCTAASVAALAATGTSSGAADSTTTGEEETTLPTQQPESLTPQTRAHLESLPTGPEPLDSAAVWDAAAVQLQERGWRQSTGLAAAVGAIALATWERMQGHRRAAYEQALAGALGRRGRVLGLDTFMDGLVAEAVEFGARMGWALRAVAPEALGERAAADREAAVHGWIARAYRVAPALDPFGAVQSRPPARSRTTRMKLPNGRQKESA